MDRERWDEIQNLFHEAADLPKEDQDVFLRAHCGQDQAMIAEVLGMLEEDAHPGVSLLDVNLAQVAYDMLGRDLPNRDLPIKQFGPYEALRLLGEGGMGVVYLARHRDLGKLVAIKVLRDAWLSPSRRQRFLTEQKTLAQLNHAFIAQLFDADTLPDGTPWFVMEYVAGFPLTQYCARNGYSLDQRLRLFRSVCEAVEHAHSHAIVHRDLKPSNILVKPDGTVKLLDFGIAKQIDSFRAPVDQTKTGLRLLTPAYAAPERIRGEQAGMETDIYSLGVILYELLTGQLPFDVSNKTAGEAAEIMTSGEPVRPSAIARQTGTRTGSWADLDILCLTAMHRDPERRYVSVEALIRDIDHYIKHEPLEARPDSVPYKIRKFLQRNWQAVSASAAILALIVVAIVLAVRLDTKVSAPTSTPQTVAVLPFQNIGADHTIDFLGFAIPDEIARILSYARSLSVRPFDLTRNFTGPNTDPQAAGHTVRAATVVTGGFSKTGNALRVILEAIDVQSKRSLWRDTISVPVQNNIALEIQVAAKIQHGLAPLLGGSEFIEPTPPRNENAYEMVLRAASCSPNAAGNKRAVEILQQSVALDANYAPAWADLAARCRLDGWYGNGGPAMLDRAEAAAERALALDPNNVVAARGLVVSRTGRGDLIRAYREAKDLVRRRPDHVYGQFALSYVLRYAGLLDEAARECDTAFLIDPLDGATRSCGITFMLRGDYRRATDFINLDVDSDWHKELSLDNLVRHGESTDATAIGLSGTPTWAAFDVFLALLQHRPAQQIAASARASKPEADPEANYLAAAHLAYVGQTHAALDMLKQSIEGGYCSYPGMDSDPFLASVRTNPEFQPIRSAAIACQKRFLSERDEPPNASRPQAPMPLR